MVVIWEFIIKSCDITSSKDSSIKNVIPNDLSLIIKNSKIKTIFTTGKKAYYLYQKYIFKDTKIKAIPLMSTSPAFAIKDVENKLYENYLQIKKFTDNF